MRSREAPHQQEDDATRGTPSRSDAPAHEDPEDAEVFDLLRFAEHPLVVRYRPTYLGHGGEHIVYEVPGHPNVVVKGNVQAMLLILEWNADHGLPHDAMDAELRAQVEEHIAESRARAQKLTEHFGAAHVPRMREVLIRVPVTGDMLGAVRGEALPPHAAHIREAWDIVRIQRRAREFDDPACASLVAGYMEQEPHLDAQQYGRCTRALVDGDATALCTPEDVRAIIAAPTRDLLARAEHDDALRDTLRDFIVRAVRYVQATGAILDLAGTGNVTVFPHHGGWSYRLVDALYPAPGEIVVFAQDAILRAARGEVLDERDTNIVYNAVNFARTVNALARVLGVADRIDLVPPAARSKVDYLTLLGGSTASSSHTPL